MTVKTVTDGVTDKEGDEQLLRAVLFEDVNEYLFSITTEEVRLSLVYLFIDFFGGRIPQWLASLFYTNHLLFIYFDCSIHHLRISYIFACLCICLSFNILLLLLFWTANLNQSHINLHQNCINTCC